MLKGSHGRKKDQRIEIGLTSVGLNETKEEVSKIFFTFFSIA